MKVRIRAEERVTYERVVEMEEAKFHSLERALESEDSTHGVNFAEEIVDIFMDRYTDANGTSDTEITCFRVEQP